MSAPPAGAQAQTRTLAGSLSKTPMPRLLVSASTARVTGTLELSCEGGESATVVFVRGHVTKVKTSAPVAYLGSVLYELGSIDDREMNESLMELARTKWLHGEILLTRAAISAVQLAEGLHEQTTRKLVHLFSMPPQTTYGFDAEVDKLANYGGTDWPHVDPIAAVWRGIRDGFATEDIETAMDKVRTSAFRLTAGATPKKFDLSDVEASAVECLRVSALTIDELAATAPIDPKRGRALVYFLLITKQAEVVDTSGVRPAFRPSSSATMQSAPPPRSMPAGMPPLPSHARPTQKFARPTEVTESAKWRAMGPIGDYASSAKIPVASPQTESAKWATGAGPRITMGGVEPTAPSSSAMRAAHPASGSGPASHPTRNDVPSQSMRAAQMMAPPSSRAEQITPPTMRAMGPTSATMKAAPPVSSSPSQSSMMAVHPELIARKQRIAERARSILKEDHFQRLSLARDASPDQVDAAFEALRTLWDPNLLPPGLSEARDDASFVMSCLAEAHQTLRDPRLRDEYVFTVRNNALRAVSDQHAEDLAAAGTNDPWAAAQACFARGDVERAERLARKAVKANAEAGGPLALLAWIESCKPSNQSATDTRPRVAMLDRALRLDPNMEQAWYWRGMLHKRLENHQAAIRDFRKTVEINPKNIDATRELRLYEMRIRRNSITMKAVK